MDDVSLYVRVSLRTKINNSEIFELYRFLLVFKVVGFLGCVDEKR